MLGLGMEPSGPTGIDLQGAGAHVAYTKSFHDTPNIGTSAASSSLMSSTFSRVTLWTFNLLPKDSHASLGQSSLGIVSLLYCPLSKAAMPTL